MKLMVTGGAGFMGSSFIFQMLSGHPDWRISCIDKLTYAGNLNSLSPLAGDPRFHFHQGDIADPDFVRDVFEAEKPEIVVNFAAESHVDRSIEDPGLFVRTNVLGVSVLAEAALKAGVKRFHQVSTDEVYGELPLDRPELLFYEDSPLRPSSPYSASKAAADLLLLSFHRTYALDVTVSRSVNNYGPRQFPEKLIPLMITKALADSPLPLYGDGLNVREWLHVSDHSSAVELIMLKGEAGEVYNVGAGNGRSNLEVTKNVLSILAKSESLISYARDRKGHDRRYAVDSGKLRRLGWRSAVSFPSGLEDTVNWYLGNRDWWQDILSGEYRKRREL